MANYINIGDIKTEGITFADNTRQTSAASNILKIKNVNGTYSILPEDIDKGMIRINSPLSAMSYAFLPSDASVPVGSQVVIASNGPGVISVQAHPPAAVKTPQSAIIERKYGRITAIKTDQSTWEIDGQLREQAQFIFVPFHMGINDVQFNIENYVDPAPSATVVIDMNVYSTNRLAIGSSIQPTPGNIVHYQNWSSISGSANVFFGTGPANGKFIRARLLPTTENVTLRPQTIDQNDPDRVLNFAFNEWIEIPDESLPNWWKRMAAWKVETDYGTVSNPNFEITFEFDVSDTPSEAGMYGTVAISYRQLKYTRFIELVNVPSLSEYKIDSFGRIFGDMNDGLGYVALGALQTFPEYGASINGDYGMYMNINSSDQYIQILSSSATPVPVNSFFNLEEVTTADSNTAMQVIIDSPANVNTDIAAYSEINSVISRISSLGFIEQIKAQIYTSADIYSIDIQNTPSDPHQTLVIGQIAITDFGPELKIMSANAFDSSVLEDVSVNVVYATRDGWKIPNAANDPSLYGFKMVSNTASFNNYGGLQTPLSLTSNTYSTSIPLGFRLGGTVEQQVYTYNPALPDEERLSWFFTAQLQDLIDKNFNFVIDVISDPNGANVVVDKIQIAFRYSHQDPATTTHYTNRSGSYINMPQGESTAITLFPRGTIVTSSATRQETIQVIGPDVLPENANAPFNFTHGLMYDVTYACTNAQAYPGFSSFGQILPFNNQQQWSIDTQTQPADGATHTFTFNIYSARDIANGVISPLVTHIITVENQQ